MRKTSVIYFYYTAKTQKKGTFYHSKCKRFLKLMTLCKYSVCSDFPLKGRDDFGV